MMHSISFWREALGDCLVIQGSNAPAQLLKLSNLDPIVNQPTFVVDSRAVTAGQIFVALPGERVDAHDFLAQAIELGAIGLIIKESEQARLKSIKAAALKKVIVFCVPDTMVALRELARTWRQKFLIPVVGVTGSIGKTTTKEMICAILQAAKIPAYVSYKNQNTFIGLYLNILQVRPEHQVAVFEVGISARGEMVQKVDVLRPTVGVITTVAHSHMQDLGMLTDIAKEKRDLFAFFKQDQVGIVFGDAPLLGEASYNHPVVRFGFKVKNQVQARMVHTDFNADGTPYAKFVLKIYKQKFNLQLPTNHRGSVHNALAATTVAQILGVEFEHIVNGLKNYKGFEKRFERRTLSVGQGELISDCYNANPESMRAALLAVHEMKTSGQKVAVIGDMLELGKKELFWHRQVGRAFARANSFDLVLLIGPRSKAVAKAMPHTMKSLWVENWQDALKVLPDILTTKESLILVKASHGVGLENLVQKISR